MPIASMSISPCKADLEKPITSVSGFPYVIPDKVPQKIAFGSGCERYPKTRESRTHNKIVILHVKPKKSKKHSKRAGSAFGTNCARFKPENRYYADFSLTRFHDIRSSLRADYLKTDFYDIPANKCTPEIRWPFKSVVPRCGQTIEKYHKPSPSDYYCKEKLPEYAVSMGFGKQRFIIPEVAVFCGPENTSKCYKCFVQPIGDYFHNFESHLDLCRECMREEMHQVKKCEFSAAKRMRILLFLGKFKPTRWCDFFHVHTGPIVTEKFPRDVLHKKMKVENYLGIYDRMRKWYTQY